MAIQKELWIRTIAESLFADNTFVQQSLDDSEFMEGNVVHLPQSGTKPTVEKNRTNLPATAAKRTDTDSTYPVDEYTTDPVILQNTEAIEVSYNKRTSILAQHIGTLEEEVGFQLSYYWATSQATQQVRTTGSARTAYKTGQTGTRKALTKADLIEVRRIMDRMDIPQMGRIALIDADHYPDLLSISEFVDANKIGGSGNISSGSIGQIFGFDVYVRSNVVMYDNTGTPVKKAPGTAVAATDNAASLFWHKNFVRRSVGNTANSGIKVFQKNDDPQFYGAVFSALVRAGGKHAYTNERGIVALIEAA